jgi:hypothetical protein
MAKILGGVQVTGFVAPSDTADVYPAHTEEYGRGGYRTVQDLTDRDAITVERRVEGMLVNVVDTGVVYQLQGGTANTDWAEFIGGGSSVPTPTEEDKILRSYDTGSGFDFRWEDLTEGNPAAFKLFEFTTDVGIVAYNTIDANGETVATQIDEKAIDVIVNGAILPPSDYTIDTNGITLGSAVASGGSLVIKAWEAYHIPDTYTQAEVDAMFADMMVVEEK